jgi:hypothetical protein
MMTMTQIMELPLAAISTECTGSGAADPGGAAWAPVARSSRAARQRLRRIAQASDVTGAAPMARW